MDKNANSKKAWYKKWWVWVIVVAVIAAISSGASNNSQSNNSSNQQATTETPKEDKPQTPAPEKWDVEANYAKINNGMTKAEVEAAIGKKSDNCSENASEYLGKTEFCNYGGFGDNGMITVHFSNDKVSSKSKNKF